MADGIDATPAHLARLVRTHTVIQHGEEWHLMLSGYCVQCWPDRVGAVAQVSGDSLCETHVDTAVRDQRERLAALKRAHGLPEKEET